MKNYAEVLITQAKQRFNSRTRKVENDTMIRSIIMCMKKFTRSLTHLDLGLNKENLSLNAKPFGGCLPSD